MKIDNEITRLQETTLDKIKGYKIAMVAHGTGSGKTRIGILWNPDLVLAPSHLIPKWWAEARSQGLGPPLTILSYQKIYAKLLESAEFGWQWPIYKRVVMDEAHMLKGKKRMWFRTMMGLQTESLLFLTATPASIKTAEVDALRTLGAHITNSIGDAKNFIFFREELSPPALQPSEITIWQDYQLHPFTAAAPTQGLPSLWVPYPADVLRVEMMIDTIKSHYPDTKRILLFSGRVKLAKQLAKRFSCPLISGEVDPKQRIKTIAHWRSCGGDLLSLTWQSSSLGMDIPDADHAIMTQVPDTPLVLAQVVGRLRRPGRTKPARLTFYCPSYKPAIEAYRRLRNRGSELAYYLYGRSTFSG